MGREIRCVRNRERHGVVEGKGWGSGRERREGCRGERVSRCRLTRGSFLVFWLSPMAAHVHALMDRRPIAKCRRRLFLLLLAQEEHRQRRRCDGGERESPFSLFFGGGPGDEGASRRRMVETGGTKPLLFIL